MRAHVLGTRACDSGYQVEELDFVGPWEVFTMARESGAVWARATPKYMEYEPEPPYDIAGWVPPNQFPEQ